MDQYLINNGFEKFYKWETNYLFKFDDEWGIVIQNDVYQPGNYKVVEIEIKNKKMYKSKSGSRNIRNLGVEPEESLSEKETKSFVERFLKFYSLKNNK